VVGVVTGCVPTDLGALTAGTVAPAPVCAGAPVTGPVVADPMGFAPGCPGAGCGLAAAGFGGGAAGFGSSPMKMDIATKICPLLDSDWAAAVGTKGGPINARPPASSATPSMTRIFSTFMTSALRSYFTDGLAAAAAGDAAGADGDAKAVILNVA